MMSTSQSDVLIVGGGPAGSTIGALLAQRGENVMLVEKDTHPRFHIGESLLPLNLPLFEELGVQDAIDRIGMAKYGVEFVSPWHNRSHNWISPRPGTRPCSTPTRCGDPNSTRSCGTMPPPKAPR